MAVFSAMAGDFSLGGYVKNYTALIYPPKFEAPFGITTPELTGAANYRFNLKASYSPVDWLGVRASYDFIPQYTGAGMNFFQAQELNDYRVADIPSRISPADYEGEGFAIKQNLDRAMISMRISFADIDIGRQAVAWGSARTVNPTDILTPFSFDALDVEERPGVDGLRVRVPLGMMSEIDAGYLPGKDFEAENSAGWANLKLYALETDVTLVLVGMREFAFAGVDIARAIRGAGTWLEFGYFGSHEFFTDGSDSDGDGYFRLTAGADYSFTGKLYGFAEYHYSGAGECSPRNYAENYSKSAFQRGGVFLNAQNYIIPGAFYQFTPLLTGSMSLIYNICDNSALISPSIEHNFAQDVYISAGAHIGFGKGGIDFPHVESEFGSYPNMWFLSFRVYF